MNRLLWMFTITVNVNIHEAKYQQTPVKSNNQVILNSHRNTYVMYI